MKNLIFDWDAHTQLQFALSEKTKEIARVYVHGWIRLSLFELAVQIRTVLSGFRCTGRARDGRSRSYGNSIQSDLI